MSHNETGSNGPGALDEEAVDGNAAYGLQAATQDSFGFEKIDSAQRQSRVNAVFRRVAERYDLMNDLMSGGLHRLWKRDLISWLAPPRGEQHGGYCIAISRCGGGGKPGHRLRYQP